MRLLRKTSQGRCTKDVLRRDESFNHRHGEVRLSAMAESHLCYNVFFRHGEARLSAVVESHLCLFVLITDRNAMRLPGKASQGRCFESVGRREHYIIIVVARYACPPWWKAICVITYFSVMARHACPPWWKAICVCSL